MTRRFAWPELALALLVSGCAVGPDFKSPAPPTADRLSAAPLPERTESADTPGGEAQRFLNDRPLPDRWWTLFGSDEIDALVAEALKASSTVKSAQAALRIAQENLREQTASLFPVVNGNFSATRQKVNLGTFGDPGGGEYIYNLYDASVGVTYGLDLWGGTRRGVEAQRAATEAQEYQLDATYQTLIANIVTTALQEALQRGLISGQEAIVADQERLLKISQRQFEIGAIGRADLLSAEANIATQRGKLPDLRLHATQAQNQLAVYLGRLPSEHVATRFLLTDLKLPQEIPLSLPSDLVRQRPDVRAAEARLHQASAQIGVATANLLPQISLTADFGNESTVLDHLFAGNIFSVSGALLQPLFHGGELTAKRREAIDAYDQSAADYRQTVLTAFQNVADTLRALETDATSLKEGVNAAVASEQSLRLTETQYRLGSAPYVNLLSAQQAYVQAQTNYGITLEARYADTAALFLALGGTWTRRDAETGGEGPSPPSAHVETSSAP